jgi:hypothetical protein
MRKKLYNKAIEIQEIFFNPNEILEGIYNFPNKQL